MYGVYREDQYFYSVYVPPRGANGSLANNMAQLHSRTGNHYCGPIDPSHMLNPMRGLSEEFVQDWPVLAKFLRIVSSNACILSILFILASVSVLFVF